MRDPIAEAIKYADRDEHEGAGYTLLVRETCGALVEVDVYRKEGMARLLRVRNPTNNPDLLPNCADYFPATIASVTVLW